ncbi:MAG TPA: TonB family protein [Sphingomonas sp.]|nr:TonB family protein [Sphingomonas sp.]
MIAPVAGPGAEPSTGAAPVPGPGSGAGGVGIGTGSGGAGDGDGAGGGVTPLRWRSGELEDDDLPRWVPEGFSGTVHLRFTVGVKGRVTDCTVTRSSGIADLDALTCRLIVKRLRYRPTLDRSGRPVPDIVTGEQTWTAYRRPPGDGS